MVIAHTIGFVLSVVVGDIMFGNHFTSVFYIVLSFSIFVKLIKFEQQSSNWIATAHLLFNIAMCLLLALTGETLILFAVLVLVNIIYAGVFEFYYCAKYCPDSLDASRDLFVPSTVFAWAWTLNQYDSRHKDEKLFRF